MCYLSTGTNYRQTVAEIRQKISRLEQKNIKVDISWTPGHANIKGNEEADRLAKEASLEAAAMKSDTEVVTMADIKQAAVKMQGFFWPVLTTDIRSCSQCQKVCFFPNLNKKIPNSRNKKKREKK